MTRIQCVRMVALVAFFGLIGDQLGDGCYAGLIDVSNDANIPVPMNCFSFGTGCYGECPPDRFCTNFGLICYCKKLPAGATAPPMPILPSPISVSTTESFQNNTLTLGGTVTGSPFAGDSIIGTNIHFSGGLHLSTTGSFNDQGDTINFAVFLPTSPVSAAFGSFFSGKVQSVVYVESPVGNTFSYTISNLAAGADVAMSPFASTLLSTPSIAGQDMGGIGLGVIPTESLFSSILAGSFPTVATDGIGQPFPVPEPPALVLLGLGVAGLLVMVRPRCKPNAGTGSSPRGVWSRRVRGTVTATSCAIRSS